MSEKHMAVFCYLIIKAINGYKAILKKNLTAAKYAAKIRELGINRIALKHTDEVKLYLIGMKINKELEQYIATSKREKSVNFHYGIEEFLQYLKKILEEYCIEDGKVINVTQKSSCALVDLIQLIGTVKDKLLDDIAEQIYQCSRTIVKYGSKEQKKMFHRIVSGNHPKHMTLFFRQLQDFVSCLDEK